MTLETLLTVITTLQPLWIWLDSEFIGVFEYDELAYDVKYKDLRQLVVSLVSARDESIEICVRTMIFFRSDIKSFKKY